MLGCPTKVVLKGTVILLILDAGNGVDGELYNKSNRDSIDELDLNET
jgi:hypothetical protein